MVCGAVGQKPWMTRKRVLCRRAELTVREQVASLVGGKIERSAEALQKTFCIFSTNEVNKLCFRPGC
jgi:hypothetical protein